LARRDLLELPEPFHVLLEGVSARARARARERVGDLHDHRLDGARLDLVVMSLDRVGDGLRLAVALCDSSPDLGVRSLDLVAHGLADVVKKRPSAGRLHRRPQLRGDEPGELRTLDQVVQHVLAIACAELELAEKHDQLWVETVHARLEHRPLALLDDPLVDPSLGLLVGLLDQRRMDTAVGAQPLERQPRDLAPDAVEAREHHRGRRLVDDDVDPGELLERADVAPVAADDPALHLVAWKLDEARGVVAGVLRGKPLHRDGQDVACSALGLVTRLALDLLKPERGLVARLLLDVRDEQLLRLRRTQTRYPVELAPLNPLGPLELLRLLLHVALAVLEGLDAALQVRPPHFEVL